MRTRALKIGPENSPSLVVDAPATGSAGTGSAGTGSAGTATVAPTPELAPVLAGAG